jgi:preprotein translocase subunit SecD
VVFLFTHPLVSLLSRMRNFGSSAFTGLDAIRGGAAVSDTPVPRQARPARTRPAAKAPARTPAPSSTAVLEADATPTQPADVPDEPAAAPKARRRRDRVAGADAAYSANGTADPTDEVDAAGAAEALDGTEQPAEPQAESAAAAPESGPTAGDEREHGAPAPGTAAERAAARRARLRDEKGDS